MKVRHEKVTLYLDPEVARWVKGISPGLRSEIMRHLLDGAMRSAEILQRLDAIERKLEALSVRGLSPEGPKDQEKEVSDDFFLEGIKDILNGGI